MSSHSQKKSVTLLTMPWSRLLTIGSVLVLAVPLAAAQETYTVQPGDTLITLAGRYGTTVGAILAANNLTGTDLLAGATLVIPEPDSYTVQPGDTLSAISVETGVPVEELMAINELSDTALVIGQELMLGGAAPSVPLVVEVEAGESLWSLAERYGVPVATLSSANGLGPDDMLVVGDELSIPGVYTDAEPSDQGGGAEPSITVASGESLSEIALRHGTSIDALMELNGLESDLLNAGETLLLPPASAYGATPQMVWPLTGVLTSYFGPRSLLGMTYHYGVDIDGATGDPIVAAMGGTVTYSGWLGGYGYVVIIEADGVEYYYGHASELLVYEGQSVAAGELIARVGSTGRSTGSHLHFEIRIDGQAVDPLPYLERTASLP
jgi:murein DD-endopeptidase MepM/ murein hydrolase activator NlpD